MAGRTAEGAARSGETVCVTGAGGYISSWLVKLLLSRGYTVHGTVRDLSDWKTAHLKQLENASENLKLFKADLLDYDGMAAAIAGCQGVFHVATPVPSGKITDPELFSNKCWALLLMAPQMYSRLPRLRMFVEWLLFHPLSPSRSTRKIGPKTRSKMRAAGQTKNSAGILRTGILLPRSHQKSLHLSMGGEPGWML